MALSSEELAGLVIQHLLDISSGQCSITREQIVELQHDPHLSEILTGLLLLHEDLLLRASKMVRAEELEQVLGKLAERNRALEESRAELAALNTQLSTPIIKIWSGVLMMPLIGAIDQRRASDMMERLLAAIQSERASSFILDVTGVVEIDTPSANALLRIVRATKLLGTETILSGLRPAVAQALVELGVDLTTVVSVRDTQEALRRCMRHSGPS